MRYVLSRLDNSLSFFGQVALSAINLHSSVIIQPTASRQMTMRTQTPASNFSRIRQLKSAQ